jgi:NTE family protein
VLQRERLKPDLVVGSSSGALVGALYAAGVRVEQIERYGEGLSMNLLRDWVFPSLGIFGGEAIARFVRERVGASNIESMPTRYAAVATDLRNGELVVLDRGDVGVAVQASSSAPGLFEPVRMGERLCVDGNLASPIPVGVARRLGAARVIAVDVTFPPGEADLANALDALYQGFSILTYRIAGEERRSADLLIEPPLPRHHDMKPDTIKALIAAGEQAAVAALPALRKLLAA